MPLTPPSPHRRWAEFEWEDESEDEYSPWPPDDANDTSDVIDIDDSSFHIGDYLIDRNHNLSDTPGAEHMREVLTSQLDEEEIDLEEDQARPPGSSSSSLSDVDSFADDRLQGAVVDAEVVTLQNQGPVSLPKREDINWKGLLVFKDRVAEFRSASDVEWESSRLPRMNRHPIFDSIYTPVDPLDEESHPREYDPKLPKSLKTRFEEEKKNKKEQCILHERLRDRSQAHGLPLDSEPERSDDESDDDWNIKPLYGMSNLSKLLERASYDYYISTLQKEQIEILGETAGGVLMNTVNRFFRATGCVESFHIISAIMYAYNRFVMVKFLLPDMKKVERITAEQLEERSRARITRYYELLHQRAERRRRGHSSTLSNSLDSDVDADDEGDGDSTTTGVPPLHAADAIDARPRRKKRRVDIPPPPQMALTSLTPVTPSYHKEAKQLASKLNSDAAKQLGDEAAYDALVLKTWQKYHPGWEVIKRQMVDEKFSEKHGFVPLWTMTDDMLFPHLFQRSGVTAGK